MEPKVLIFSMYMYIFGYNGVLNLIVILSRVFLSGMC